MALRDQPYLPLYVQDLLTDEKLIECSASAHGVYLRLICILHKQEVYGQICLKQKYKQIESKYDSFAQMLIKQMPFEAKTISESIRELTDENVIVIEGDLLTQKRMFRDGHLSIARTEAGKKGGSNVTKQYGKKGFLYLMSDGYDKSKIGISVNPGNRLYRLRSDLKLPKHFDIKYQIEVEDMGKSEDFAQEFFKDILDGEWLKDSYLPIEKRFVLLQAKIKAKTQANSENEYVIENESENVIINEDLKAKKNELTNLLCEKFGWNEMRFSNKQRDVSAFVSVKILTQDDYDNFGLQFQAYDEYKKLSEERRHNPQSLIGTQSEQFNDSVLLSENWIVRLENFKQIKPKSKLEKVADNHHSKNPYL